MCLDCKTFRPFLLGPHPIRIPELTSLAKTVRLFDKTFNEAFDSQAFTDTIGVSVEVAIVCIPFVTTPMYAAAILNVPKHLKNVTKTVGSAVRSRFHFCIDHCFESETSTRICLRISSVEITTPLDWTMVAETTETHLIVSTCVGGIALDQFLVARITEDGVADIAIHTLEENKEHVYYPRQPHCEFQTSTSVI